MKVLLRGATEFREFPDLPTAPTSLGAPAARGSEAPAGTQVTSDHGVARADSTSAPAVPTTFDATPSAPATPSFAHTGAPVQFLTVTSAVTEVQPSTITRSGVGGLGETGGGEIARGADALASLSLDGPAHADHGWFIVPSASNEYGPAYGAADDFTFDVAAGAFSADWFFWA